MKKVFSLIAVLCLMLSALPSASAELYIPENTRSIPASVYKEPFPVNQIVTEYAPWLRHLHFMNENEYNQGLYGGEGCQLIRVMAISPVNPKKLYFISDTTGVWKSNDGGEHWYNTNNNIASFYGVSVLCDRLDENTVFAYLGRDGLYRSTNGGREWQRLLKDPTQSDWKNLIAQDASGNVYVANYNGIHRIDRGSSNVVTLYGAWGARDKNTGAPTRDIWVSDDGMTIYVAVAYAEAATDVKGGLYCSFDGGKTWEIREPLSEEGYVTNLVSVEAYPGDAQRVYISGSKYSLGEKKNMEIGVYESFDGGKTATKISQITYENKAENVAPTVKWAYQLNFGPMENGVYPLYCFSSQIQFPHRVSYDCGKTWQTMYQRYGQGTFRVPEGKAGETGWWGQGYAIDHKNPGVVWLAVAGPNKWDHGTLTWKSSGYSGLSLTYLSMNAEGKLMATATDVGTIIGMSKYTEGNYPFFQTGDSGIKTMFVIDPNDENHIIGFDGNSNSNKKVLGIQISYDGGRTYTETLKDTETTGNTSVLMYDPDDPNTIYSSDHTSHDNGKTWIKNERRLIAISRKNPDRMLARTIEGDVAAMYLSTDRGKTWTHVFNGRKDYIEVQFDMADDRYVWYSSLYNFGKVDLETGKVEEMRESDQFPYKFFHHFAQNPKDHDHFILSTRCWADDDSRALNPQYMESRDHGKTWHVIPGLIATQTQRVYFSTTTDEAFLMGHAGTFIYSYKKYWEFLDSKITVQLDDREVSFSVMPEIKEGRTMVPMRELFEMLGATVNWDGETRTVTANKERSSVRLQIDNLTVNMNGKEKQMEAAPYIINGRTMVPLRFASEALGIRVGWDSLNRLIVMKSE